MYTDTSAQSPGARGDRQQRRRSARRFHCKKIDVILHADGSLEVIDDGRGMPVDMHPKEKIPGVEVILTAARRRQVLQQELPVLRRPARRRRVGRQRAVEEPRGLGRRGGKEYNMSFANGEKTGKLEVVGKVGKRQHRHDDPFLARSESTSIRAKFSSSRDSSTCCAPKRCCVPASKSRSRSRRPRNRRRVAVTRTVSRITCSRRSTEGEMLPEEPFVGSCRGQQRGGRLGGGLAARRRRGVSPRATST